MFGNGLLFNGTTPDTVAFSTLSLPGNLTVAAWVKPGSSGYMAIADLADGNGYGFDLDTNPGNTFRVRADNATASNQITTGSASVNLRDGGWHHVAFTFVRIYNRALANYEIYDQYLSGR